MSDNQAPSQRNSQESTQTLLSRLLMARGPGGQEDEVRAICLEELQRHCDEVWTDPAGNVIGLLKGRQTDPDGKHAVRIMGHMDEIAMVVKRVEPDGTLRVVALGGANPVNFGVCPVDILGDTQTLPGVLSFGSMHATTGSPQGKDVMSGALEWKDVHVITRQDQQTLQNMGVRPGTRVVLSQHWRTPFRVGDAIAAHFLDDRAPVVAMLQAAEQLKHSQIQLKHDTYFVFTTLEEESNAGAMYAAAHLPGDTTIAVEVGPVMSEYATRLSVDPIIDTGDQKGYYSRGVVAALADAAKRCGFNPQFALLVDFASDASAVMSSGISAQAGCVAIPTENTHGYELVVDGAIEACAATLVEYLKGLRTEAAT
ncbi:M20/M25/M40 family metallo-hydrolase [Pseudomonas sp. SWRI153]|uniref:M20/M25/M40 family metallo-hydrolase n=1 Tax=Pseudomonas khorasanensis TaxID=2745508 RepID=A0A923JCZ3_9PSED|nr:M20/M25/M40 family metallo-hydrolase [Pseudomonas khorasanensis]MBV4484530.1 M20/M25/M40 family metallo-hydrolase [Pseudomonas khorasanensis]